MLHFFNIFSYDIILIMGLSLLHLNSKIIITGFLTSQESSEIMKGAILPSQWKGRRPLQKVKTFAQGQGTRMLPQALGPF